MDERTEDFLSPTAAGEAAAGAGMRQETPGAPGTAISDEQDGSRLVSRRTMAPETALRSAQGLGWFSLGLGLAQVLAAGAVARMVLGRATKRGRKTMRLLGLRELATGFGLLSAPRPSTWMWARVLGDGMDLALLGMARTRRIRKAAVTRSMLGVLGVGALDVATAVSLARSESALQAARSIVVSKSIIINKSPGEVYRFWRDLEELPRFMTHLESVEKLEGNRSRWIAKGPGGVRVSWEAEIVDDRPNEILSWRSLEGADVPNAGTVRFARAPGGRGTLVEVTLLYDPPAGNLGVTLAKLFGREPSQQVDGDLRRLKQVLETGEVVHSDASLHRRPHAARPPSESELPTTEVLR